MISVYICGYNQTFGDVLRCRISEVTDLIPSSAALGEAMGEFHTESSILDNHEPLYSSSHCHPSPAGNCSLNPLPT
jgi:hypothetical protein